MHGYIFYNKKKTLVKYDLLSWHVNTQETVRNSYTSVAKKLLLKSDGA